MSTLLIWSDEIQKFTDLLKENKKLPSTYDQFMVLGTELRISDYNKLRQLPIPDDKLRLSTALSEKRDTLLFVLGMLKAKEETHVCTIASVSKELSDFAKEQDMELLSMAAAAKGSDKKTTKPRVRNLRKNESVAEESNKTLNLNDNKGTDSITEPVKNESIDESEKTEETVPGLLEDLVKAAEKKTGYGYSKRIDEIRKAVATASDEKIGLPFQMQMLFGEKGQALADELTGFFRELKGGN